jgi:hypothetical protein
MNKKPFGGVSVAVLDDGLTNCNWEDGECCVCTGVNTVVSGCDGSECVPIRPTGPEVGESLFVRP